MLVEKNWKDEDIKEDVENVKSRLDEMLQDMSTFDSYLAEVGLSCFVMFRHVLSCFVMFCHVLSCFVMFCHVLSCFVMFVTI